LHWLGIVLIALGVAAVLTPDVTGSALVIVIGFILLVTGLALVKLASMMNKLLGRGA